MTLPYSLLAGCHPLVFSSSVVGHGNPGFATWRPIMTGKWLIIWEDHDGEVMASIENGKKKALGKLGVIIDHNLSRAHIAAYPPGTWEDEVLRK